MKRRNLIKGLGALGLGAMIPLPQSIGATEAKASEAKLTKMQIAATSCWLTPALTQGPFYLNANLIRQNITEGRPGIP
ncbi:MAG: protocatechuate dioxygenase, partial [Bacteroidota bacterium]|nr:protocatechuate dioxygenase [Bacteroidota bacterium]